jgi:hypothetical protein
MEPPNWSRLVSGKDAAAHGIHDVRLRERVAGAELVALQELEGAAVERVGAGLGLHGHHARDGLPELGVIVLGR